MANPGGYEVLDDRPNKAGTQVHAPQLGLVTNVYPSKDEQDRSDYLVDVRLLRLGGASEKDEHEFSQVPVTTDHLGSTRGLTVNTMVLVQFVDGDTGRPLVTDVLYNEDDQAPITEKGDWRVRVDSNTVLEVVNDSAGDKFVRIGRQPDDGADLDMGLQLNIDTGQVEFHDGSDTGLCSDGNGNWVMDSETFYFPGLNAAYSNTPYSTQPGGPTPASNVSWNDSTPYRELPSPRTKSVNLADEGLSDGDDVSPYLRDNVKNGNSVVIPSGTYQWDGTGLSGNYKSAEIVGGETSSTETLSADSVTAQAASEQTVLEIPQGLDEKLNITCNGGSDGSVHLRNLRIDGEFGKGGLQFAVTDPKSSMIVENVEMTDGNQSETLGSDSSAAISVPPKHAGTLYLRNLNIQNFGNTGVYASLPGLPSEGGRLGRTIVEGGYFANNNIANVRVGGKNSAIRKIVSIQDGSAPSIGGTVNARSLWITDRVTATVEECDVVHQTSSGTAVVLGGGAEGDLGSSGQVNSNRFEQSFDQVLIDIDAGDWGGSNNHFSGSGTFSNGGDFTGTVTGTDADSPNTSPDYV